MERKRTGGITGTITEQVARIPGGIMVVQRRLPVYPDFFPRSSQEGSAGLVLQELRILRFRGLGWRMQRAIYARPNQ